MKHEFEEVPLAAITHLASQLESFGCIVNWFVKGHSGEIISEAGKVQFQHYWRTETLEVTIIEDKGHFHGALLKGGMRQLVEEACEDVKRVTNKGIQGAV